MPPSQLTRRVQILEEKVEHDWIWCEVTDGRFEGRVGH
jgi:hypothetical protein